MSSIHRPQIHTSPEPVRTTMLDLVMSLTESGTPEDEVVETARHLIRSGRAVLTGSFRNAPAESF